jgi:hypothetical protein
MTPSTAATQTPSWWQQVEGFCYKRKKATGGFSATPRLPPTIQDTYHAINILAALAKQGLTPASPNDGPLLIYLSQARPAEAHSAKVTFQRLAALRLAGGAVEVEPIKAFIRRRLTETATLEERYYCCRLAREVLGLDDPDQFHWLPEPTTGWSFRTATELWMLLTLAQGQPPGERDLTSWLQACQTYDGGFGFFPGTTSFMENGYDCLRALRRLGSTPRDPEGCRAFILACHNQTGGFARKGGATAFLSSTWQAVASLDLLAHGEG